MTRLRKILSGGQTGADLAGLVVAKRFGLQTGGTIPKGFRTLAGPRPELGSLYGLVEHQSDGYVPRTYKNVHDAGGTVRLAGNFGSRGEVCTLNAITKYEKPHFDVDLTDLPPVSAFVGWLTENNIEILNVAGNAEQTYKGAYGWSERFLTEAMFSMGFEMTLYDDEILRALGLEPNKQIIYTHDRLLVDRLTIRRIGVSPRRGGKQMHEAFSSDLGEDVEGP